MLLAAADYWSSRDVHQDVSGVLASQGPGIVYSRLLRLRSGPGVALPSLEVECDLCLEWQHPDPLTYVFRLREDVRWQDLPPLGARPLSPRDVAFSLDRLRTPGWPGAVLLASMASVEATEPATVTIRLASSDADFLLALAHGQAKVVAPEAVALRGDLREGPTVGTGPWVLAREELGQAVFRPNPRYHEEGVPSLQELRIVPIADNQTRLAAFLAGQVDMTVVDEVGWERLPPAGQGVGRGAFPLPGTGLLFGLRATASPLDSLPVRQAVFQAMDPWEALESVWRGRGSVGVGVPLFSPQWGLRQEELRAYFGNQAKAAGLLSQAGLSRGVPLTLTVADFGDRYLALGRKFQGFLQEAGFAVSTEAVNPRVYAERVWRDRDYQAFLGPLPPAQGPNAFLYGLLHSRGRWRLSGYEDPELDRLIEAQAVALDGRQEMLVGVERYVLERALLFMPVSGSSLWVWKPRVADLYPNVANWEYFHWARLRVKE
ncbi:MAG: ABC transporter substrate-binding protein [Chloroflexi bacterium]|nr:ABC transporter substrate-binding protein [Chloroflexota bacterium]